jgi:hypothetical protein
VTRRVRLIIVGVAIVAVLGAAYVGADRVYLTPMDAKRAELAKLRRDVGALGDALIRGDGVRARWQAVADRMIASSDQEAEHLVRTLASRVGAEAGLREVVVSHGQPRAPSNPAGDRRSRVARSLRSAIEEREDFRVLRGTLRGEGSLEQVIDAMLSLDAQPWAHRIESVKIEPAGRDRDTIELVMGFATMYATDTRTGGAAGVLPIDPGADTRVAALRQTNPFVVPAAPPAPPPETVVVAPAPAVPPPPPYDQWQVSGVLRTVNAASEETTEVILVRRDTGETRSLHPGETLLGFELVRVTDSGAVFGFEARTWTVLVGDSLASRTPAD